MFHGPMMGFPVFSPTFPHSWKPEIKTLVDLLCFLLMVTIYRTSSSRWSPLGYSATLHKRRLSLAFPLTTNASAFSRLL